VALVFVSHALPDPSRATARFSLRALSCSRRSSVQHGSFSVNSVLGPNTSAASAPLLLDGRRNEAERLPIPGKIGIPSRWWTKHRTTSLGRRISSLEVARDRSRSLEVARDRSRSLEIMLTTFDTA
jgi:hypothetical protein